MPSLYVHVPFCVRKCSYCGFYSIPLDRIKIKDYLSDLEREINLRKQESLKGVSTLFIGGGTPTALSELELDNLLSLINSNYSFQQGAERTIEANPGTLTTDKLKILRKHGINRISLGVQSFNNSLLKQIGRIHQEQEVLAGVKDLRQMGFANLNLDLIFGLPGQTLDDWKITLEKAIEIKPEHISVYGLMVEEGTALAMQEDWLKVLPDDEHQAQMYDLTREFLAGAGYNHYETSNYALPGYECQHNLGYWQGKEYIGIGPGAVSFYDNRRWKNIENLGLYHEALKQERIPVDPDEDEELTEKDRIAERIILGLRLAKGVELEGFRKEFGKDIYELYPQVLERYLKTQVLMLEKGNLRINPQYWFVANSVLQEFV